MTYSFIPGKPRIHIWQPGKLLLFPVHIIFGDCFTSLLYIIETMSTSNCLRIAKVLISLLQNNRIPNGSYYVCHLQVIGAHRLPPALNVPSS